MPLEVLSQLTSDPDPSVRCRAAENAAIPANALERLASDADQSVRFCALGQIAARDAQGSTMLRLVRVGNARRRCG